MRSLYQVVSANILVPSMQIVLAAIGEDSWRFAQISSDALFWYQAALKQHGKANHLSPS